MYHSALLTSRPGRPGLPCSPPSPLSPFWPCQTDGRHLCHLLGWHQKVLALLPAPRKPGLSHQPKCPHGDAETHGLDSPSAHQHRPPRGAPVEEQHGKVGDPAQGSPPPSRTTTPFIPPAPTEPPPLSWTPTPQLGVHIQCFWGAPPGPHPTAPSAQRHSPPRHAAPSRPVAPPHTREEEEGVGWRGVAELGQGVHGGWGGLTCTGPSGWVRTQSAPCGSGEAAQGLCLHPSWPGMGDHGGQQDPHREHPQFRGVPAWDTTGDTHTLAFLPLAAGDAGDTALALPALQKRGRVGDKTGHGSPHVLTCAHSRTQGSRAAMLRAQLSICVATSLREPGSVCPAVTNPPLELGDRVSPRERGERCPAGHAAPNLSAPRYPSSQSSVPKCHPRRPVGHMGSQKLAISPTPPARGCHRNRDTSGKDQRPSPQPDVAGPQARRSRGSRGAVGDGRAAADTPRPALW